ncbi:small integral membrane protein 12 isoform X1 [Canis lupus dingo]|uniref:small integral membrane protein 12 isoform X1 n=1 Tax=Canis lupus dingo TaxID=286419 RepID=UPI000BAA1356|nr:small integral membrane protein 12 isoform X1 [Canis lupus dingo]XP_038543076.1 small integral membrane protein 12 isoform X1 [Canis lupus familiaris]|eukprot:XP_022283357.1 small integral membrane protein 12 isoform X1 [Canis lupus familiaris]
MMVRYSLGSTECWDSSKENRNQVEREREDHFLVDVMWPVLWTVVRTYAPYVTFPVAFVVGAVGYHLEWFIRGKDPQPAEEEKSISERREDRKLDELLGKDHTQVVSLKDKLEFAPKAVLNRNRPEKN